MDDERCAHVPRRLRVRGTVQLGMTRLTVRLFLTLVALLVLGAALLVAGVALTRLTLGLGSSFAVLALCLEGRWAGRSSWMLGRNFVHDQQRRGLWRWQPQPVQVAERPVAVRVLPLRWQPAEVRDGRA